MVAAVVIAGKNFGQLPVATMPLGIIVTAAFACYRPVKLSTRFLVLLVGRTAFVLLAWWTA